MIHIHTFLSSLHGPFTEVLLYLVRTRGQTPTKQGGKAAHSLFPKQPLSLSESPHAESLSMSFLENIVRRIKEGIKRVLNNPTQTRRTGRQDSTPYTTVLTPPSFPSRPGTSILICCRSGGSLTARRWTGKDAHSRCQCMSFGQYNATTAE